MKYGSTSKPDLIILEILQNFIAQWTRDSENKKNKSQPKKEGATIAETNQQNKSVAQISVTTLQSKSHFFVLACW
jgi:hypothetical protein